uniref:Candidate secreted effector n=1 Tax=Meloidogyne incognita TaxID=6306 RepID=A0A914M5L5_MELIC
MYIQRLFIFICFIVVITQALPREKRNPFSDTNSIENNLNFTTTTQSPDEDLLSKMLVNDMDESVRQMEM